MPHFTERDIKEASTVNLVEFARSQGFDLKKEDKKAHRVLGYGGLFLFEHGFKHHSEDKKGNSIHFCREYMDMGFQEAVKSLLEFKGVLREEEYAPRKESEYRVRPPPQSYGRGDGGRKQQPPPQNYGGQVRQQNQPPPQNYGRQDEWRNQQPPPQNYGRQEDWQNQQPPPQNYGRQEDWRNQQPPPQDDFYGMPPPDFFGEPPPEANSFYGESLDYNWGNVNPVPQVEQYFRGNLRDEQTYQNNPPKREEPSQPIPPSKSQEDLIYDLPNDYEHDFFQPRPKSEPEEKKELLLPPHSPDKDGSATFKYLTETRCCDKAIVDKLMKEGHIFEAETGAKGYKFKNVAFVGKDKDDNVKYCSLRGMQNVFKQDVKNSSKNFGFTMKGTSDRIFCCESPIDVLSHATLTKMNNNDPFQDTRISMGGLFDKALEQFISDNPQIKTIVFAFDNDITGTNSKGEPHNHGQEFAKKCCEKYSKLGFKVQIQTPKGKDFNEVLVEKSKTSIKKQLAHLGKEVKSTMFSNRGETQKKTKNER